MGPEAIRHAMDRILSHTLFTGSARLSGFCRYVVEETLADRSGQIKESTIGMVVYGRRPDYDPKIDSIVRVEASRLRAKLRQYYAADGSNDPIRIELPSGSYVPVFSNHAEHAPTPQAVIPEAASPAPPASRNVFRRGRIAMAATGIAIAAFSGYELAGRSAVDVAFTVAVMPFSNLTGDAALDGYATAFAEQTAVQLASDPGIRVVRVSAKGTASQSKAPALLNGSIQSEGGYSLVVHLDDPVNGRQIWSKTLYSRKLTPMQFQDSGARLVARTLNRRFGGRSLSDVERETRHKPSSEEMFVRGHQEWLTQGPHGIENAIGLFREAVRQDPKFADAWAELGAATLLMAYREPVKEKQWLGEATLALEKALTLDNRNAEAHARLGNIYLEHRHDFESAERELQLAVELNPGSDAQTRWFALAACLRGKRGKARRELEFGLMANPTSETLLAEMARLEFDEGRLVEAEDLAGQSVARMANYAPARFLLGLIHERGGDTKGAREEFRACSGQSGWPFDCRASLAILDSRSGNPYSELAAQFPRHYSRALLQLASRQPDLAGKEIESGLREHELFIEYACLDPRLRGLLKDAQFQACAGS